jgi:hypothetical protein
VCCAALRPVRSTDEARRSSPCAAPVSPLGRGVSARQHLWTPASRTVDLGTAVRVRGATDPGDDAADQSMFNPSGDPIRWAGNSAFAIVALAVVLVARRRIRTVKEQPRTKGSFAHL